MVNARLNEWIHFIIDNGVSVAENMVVNIYVVDGRKGPLYQNY